MVNKNDKDTFGLASDSNLDAQAKIMLQLADDVAKHIETNMNSVYKRLSAAQQKSLSPMQKALNALEENQQRYERDYLSMKDRFKINYINQFTDGGKFDPKATNDRLLKSLGDILDKALSVYVTNPIKTGIAQMANAFESNFTEIAGRAGTNRAETYSLMRDAVATLNASSFKGAINANTELIPAIKAATQQGFNDERAAEIGLSNAIDSKLMPWLDTASDNWANLVANLDTQAIKQFKAQQLQLQATETGNRLLQSGVINSLTSELAPILTNIDFNTGGTQNLAPEAMAYMESLMEQGFTASEAYAEASSVIRDWKDPMAALERGDYQGVMRFANYYSGDDSFQGMATAGLEGLNLAVGAGRDYGFIANTLGVGSQRGINRSQEGARILEALNNVNWDSLKGASQEEYEAAISQLVEKVTATQQWDNTVENTITNLAYPLNDIPHGVDMLTAISSDVSNILKVIIGKGLYSMLPGGGSGLASGAAGAGAGLAGQYVLAKNIGKTRLNPRTGKPINYLDVNTLYGSSAADDYARNMGQTGAKGSAGKVSKIGKIGKIGTAGKIGAVGGIIGAVDGIGGTADYISQGETGKAVISGIGTALSTGGAIASFIPGGQVIGLALSGVGIAAQKLGPKIYDLVTAIDKSEEELNSTFDSLKTTNDNNLEAERQKVQSLSSQLSKTEDIEEARNLVIESGIATEEEASNASITELQKLTDAYGVAAEKFGQYGEDYLEDVQEKLTEEQEKQKNTLIDDLANAFQTNDVGSITNEEDLANISGIINKTLWGDNKSTALGFLDDGEINSSEWSSLIGMIEKNSSLDALNTANDVYKFSGTSIINPSQAELGRQSSAVGKARTYFEKGDTDEAYKTLLDFIDNSELDYTQYRDSPVYSELRDIIKTVYNEDKDKYAELKDYAEYAVGSDYIYSDRLAMLHKGEAVIRASENENNLKNILDLSQSQVAQRSSDNASVISAINAQTADIKILLENILTALSRGYPSKSLFSNSHSNVTSMLPEVANTRIVSY